MYTQRRSSLQPFPVAVVGFTHFKTPGVNICKQRNMSAMRRLRGPLVRGRAFYSHNRREDHGAKAVKRAKSYSKTDSGK